MVMIEFQLDAGSGVATLLAACSAGAPGPAAWPARAGRPAADGSAGRRELAINPNTVLKAYRDLEREGWYAPGQDSAPLSPTVHDCRPSKPAFTRACPTGFDRRARLVLAPKISKRSIARLFATASRRGGMTAVTDARARQTIWAPFRAAGLHAFDPEGKVVGLVGPNGAGKTTLLQLAVGLLADCGRHPGARCPSGDGAAQLDRVGFVAQQTPAYASLSVANHLRMGAWLNANWDGELAQRRIGELGLNPRQRAGSLSGGQRAQLALTLAIAKRPDLLILDEPVAGLDPLARRTFLAI